MEQNETERNRQIVIVSLSEKEEVANSSPNYNRASRSRADFSALANPVLITRNLCRKRAKPITRTGLSQKTTPSKAGGHGKPGVVEINKTGRFVSDCVHQPAIAGNHFKIKGVDLDKAEAYDEVGLTGQSAIFESRAIGSGLAEKWKRRKARECR